MTQTTLKTILFAIVAAMANGATFGYEPIVPPVYPKANVKVIEVNEKSKNINRYGDLSQSINHEKIVDAYRNRIRQAERYSNNVNHNGAVSISRNVDKSVKNDINKYSYHDSDSYNADSDELSVSRKIKEHLQTKNHQLKHTYSISDNVNSAGSISFSENQRHVEQYYGHSRTLSLSNQQQSHSTTSKTKSDSANSDSSATNSQTKSDSKNSDSSTANSQTESDSKQSHQSDSYTKTASQNHSQDSYKSSDKSASKQHGKAY